MVPFDKFSERAQDVANRAAEIIQRYGHNLIETEHIMLALVEQPDGMVTQILDLLNIDVTKLTEKVDKILRTTPKANIWGGNSGPIFMTNRVRTMVDVANNEANRMGDEYISTEHMFLAILAERNTPLARALEEAGLNRQNVIDAIQVIRGVGRPQRSESKAETHYKTLEKYSRDLTRLAEEGKLDPIYGREIEITRLIQILCRRTKNNPFSSVKPAWEDCNRRRFSAENY